MTKRITIRIAADGSMSAESGGRQGPKCIDDAELIAALCDFATIVDSRLTPEYELPALVSAEEDVRHYDRDDR
jgi:hypothetical protein